MKRVNTLIAHCVQSGVAEGEPTLPSVPVSVRYRSDNGEDDVRLMALHDGRPSRESFSLDAAGFQLLSLDAPISAPWADGQSVGKLVYPQAEKYIAQATGASKVLVFDHALRDPTVLQPEEDAGIARDDPRATPFLGRPGDLAHNDYTVRSGFTRARQILEPYGTTEAVNRALQGRFAIINFWYPLETVTDMPLAMCTWDSSCPADVSTVHIDYGHRTGETYRVHHNPAHKWVYFSQMSGNEALLLKTFDSSEEVARFALHSAVPHKEPVAHVKPRRSIELRSLVFYDEFPDSLKDLDSKFLAPHLKLGYSESRASKVTVLPPSGEW